MTKNQYKNFVLFLQMKYSSAESLLHYSKTDTQLNQEWCSGVEHAYKEILQHLGEELHIPYEAFDRGRMYPTRQRKAK